MLTPYAIAEGNKGRLTILSERAIPTRTLEDAVRDCTRAKGYQAQSNYVVTATASDSVKFATDNSFQMYHKMAPGSHQLPYQAFQESGLPHYSTAHAIRVLTANAEPTGFFSRLYSSAKYLANGKRKVPYEGWEVVPEVANLLAERHPDQLIALSNGHSSASIVSARVEQARQARLASDLTSAAEQTNRNFEGLHARVNEDAERNEERFTEHGDRMDVIDQSVRNLADQALLQDFRTHCLETDQADLRQDVKHLAGAMRNFNLIMGGGVIRDPARIERNAAHLRNYQAPPEIAALAARCRRDRPAVQVPQEIPQSPARRLSELEAPRATHCTAANPRAIVPRDFRYNPRVVEENREGAIVPAGAGAHVDAGVHSNSELMSAIPRGMRRTDQERAVAAYYQSRGDGASSSQSGRNDGYLRLN